jgi:hypothetical protein
MYTTWKELLVHQQAEGNLSIGQVAEIEATMVRHYEAMSTEDLHCLYWEAFKDVNGFRPRFVKADDRDAFLLWFCGELLPWIREMREEEDKAEEEWDLEEKRIEIKEAAERKEQTELQLAYCTDYDHFDERLK